MHIFQPNYGNQLHKLWHLNQLHKLWHLTNLNTSYINCGNHSKNKNPSNVLLHLLLLVPLLAFFPFPPSGWVAANRRTVNHQENVTNICSYFTNKNELLLHISYKPNRSSYSSSLFVAEKLNLKDFSIIILSRDIRTSPTPNPLWFTAPTYTFQDKGSYKEIAPIDFSSMFYFCTLFSNGVLANLTTRLARNPWQKC